MGLADLHVHTIYSYDATSSVSAALKFAAHHAKLNVVAITDHDRLDGALEALEIAPAYGIEVIPGVEVSSKEGHILALFVNQVIPAGLTLEATVVKTLEAGGICIIPHPMMNNRISVNPHAIRRALRDPAIVQGLVGFEAFNAGLAGAQRDLTALSLAKQLPLTQVGCSDAHIEWAIGMGATYFPGHTAADLFHALKTHHTYAIGKRQLELGEFIIRFVPRLVLRYAGWVGSNTAPTQPLRLARAVGFLDFSRSSRAAPDHTGAIITTLVLIRRVLAHPTQLR